MSSSSTKWILELVDKISSPLKNIDANINEIVGDTTRMNKGLKDTSAININAIADSFRSLKGRLDEAIQPGIEFQNGLAEVEAITGVTGDALDSLGSKARKSAKTFGGDASDSLDNYKIILSKLGSDIAQSEDALDSMNSNVLTLSKTMGGDSVGAVDALTASMLQFRVDLTDPIKAGKEMTDMMNTMAAGAKFGSAEVPQVAAAIKVSGVAASQAKVSFGEANAAIQELARGGKEGAEGGIAFRNVLGKMAGADVIPKQALGKLQALGVNMAIVSDTTLPLTVRLRELGKAQNDATAFSQVFGTENAAAAAILTRSVDAQDDLLTKIVGTNVATEQAAVIMGTYSQRMSRYGAWFKDIGISIFNGSKSFLPFINGGFSAIDVLADLKNAQQGVAMIMNTKLGTGLKFIGKGFKWAGNQAWGFVKKLALTGIAALKSGAQFIWSGAVGLSTYVSGLVTAAAAQWGLNIAMNANPIGLIVIGIGLAIGAIVLMVKYWDQIKTTIWNFTKFIWKISPFKFLIDLAEKIFPGFKQGIKNVFTKVMDFAMEFWEKIKGIFTKIKNFFGFGDEKGSTIKVEVKKTKKGTAVVTGGDLNLNESINPPVAGSSAKESITGSGSSTASKSITMNLEIKNIFNVSDAKANIDDMVDQVVGRITDKLRDSVIALD